MGSTLSPALAMALFVAGVFTTVLGVVHVAIPRLLDFDHAIPRDGAGLPPLRTIAFGRWQYTVLRQDVAASAGS